LQGDFTVRSDPMLLEHESCPVPENSSPEPIISSRILKDEILP